MNFTRLFALPVVTLLLAACSGHPGAGTWQTIGEANPDFIKEFITLKVRYEGRTDIFGPEGEKTASEDDKTNGAIRRCFWQGTDAQTIAMTCVQAADTEKEESYHLRVDPNSGVAELVSGEKVVGRFKRQLPVAQ